MENNSVSNNPENECSTCNGSGTEHYTVYKPCTHNPVIDAENMCPYCDGEGTTKTVHVHKCSDCNTE